ncbi:hypothetical protein BDW02DRAFT_269415 [Decorospora gaudefroyi]|uniref:Uncharacterized protein n=1 Tax=Decorospora gaudefroyi TaxID=184978 RepID=A0A6A5KJJ1_9PLEO|nr:hypothetical protein BDW02DRAFT_269415 [Decorospora gaudefroyi]
MDEMQRVERGASSAAHVPPHIHSPTTNHTCRQGARGGWLLFGPFTALELPHALLLSSISTVSSLNARREKETPVSTRHHYHNELRRLGPTRALRLTSPWAAPDGRLRSSAFLNRKNACPAAYAGPCFFQDRLNRAAPTIRDPAHTTRRR